MKLTNNQHARLSILAFALYELKNLDDTMSSRVDKMLSQFKREHLRDLLSAQNAATDALTEQQYRDLMVDEVRKQLGSLVNELKGPLEAFSESVKG